MRARGGVSRGPHTCASCVATALLAPRRVRRTRPDATKTAARPSFPRACASGLRVNSDVYRPHDTHDTHDSHDTHTHDSHDTTRYAVEGDAHPSEWSQLVAVSGRNPDLGSDDGLVCGKLALALGLLLPGRHKVSSAQSQPAHDTTRHDTTTTVAAYLDLKQQHERHRRGSSSAYIVPLDDHCRRDNRG
jgi:hypothetical protein